jgi:two-component system, sensor histidine kinase and response regulator
MEFRLKGENYMKILIAEDEPKFRHLLGDILSRWGYDVVVAPDGNEAWMSLNSTDPPQLAILDWMMPGIDGVELCRKVRKEMPEPYTYLILLTALNQEEDLVTGMEAGADDYINKPLNINELHVRLNAGRRILELQEGLKAANRDLESFSITVANDLIKPLMAIGENAHAIRDLICSKEDELCITYTRRIYEKTKKLGELIGIMHDFFRPTQREFHRETIDLSGMVGKKAEKLRMKQPERRVEFRITEGIKVNGDRNLLNAVLDNLLDNAWKHTCMCEEAIIEFGVTEDGGKQTCFVRDNGAGFDMVDADKLFKPFQGIYGSEEFAGKGIGLATVERIIRRHGGKIWAEGASGKGATFYFII